MSPTVNKILVHGHQIMDSSILPVGVLGEHASDSRNNASRLQNITDVFNRALDSSDLLISSLSLKDRAP